MSKFSLTNLLIAISISVVISFPIMDSVKAGTITGFGITYCKLLEQIDLDSTLLIAAAGLQKFTRYKFTCNCLAQKSGIARGKEPKILNEHVSSI
jgi:hypothetical protein